MSSSSSSSSSSSPSLGAKSTADQVIDALNLQGSLKGVNVLLTGGTSGIGLETARTLAFSAKANVYLAARNKQKAESVVNLLRSSSPDSETGSITVVEMSLSSLAGVRAGAEEFKKLNVPLNIIINNAAIFEFKYGRNCDGFESHFFVNYLAPALLTLLLTPLLSSSAANSPTFTRSRVVNVSSGLHAVPKPTSFSDFILSPSAGLIPGSVDPDAATFAKLHTSHYYNVSKFALNAFTREYARLYVKSGIDAFVLHPGIIRTPLNEAFSEQMKDIYNKDTKQGASTTVFAAVAPTLFGRSGLYLSDCQVVGASPFTAITEISEPLLKSTLTWLSFESTESLPLSPPKFTVFTKPKTDADLILPTSAVSLRGKVVLVTGASSGIGVETAKTFAKAGAHVFIGARNRDAGLKVIDEIKSSTGNDSVELLLLDLTSFQSVTEAAQNFIKRGLPLHYLILNAGIMATPFKIIEGHESQFTVNHLSHFLFAHLLTPVLIKSAPSRVVSLSSIAHKRANVDLNDINFQKKEYNKWNAYGQSKTANIYFAFYFNKLYASQGVNAVAVHPGGIFTGLQKELSEEEMQALGWKSEAALAMFKSVSEGASTSVWAAISHELYLRGGVYAEDIHVAKYDPSSPPFVGLGSHIATYTDEVGAALWEYSLKATNQTPTSKI